MLAGLFLEKEADVTSRRALFLQVMEINRAIFRELQMYRENGWPEDDEYRAYQSRLHKNLEYVSMFGDFNKRPDPVSAFIASERVKRWNWMMMKRLTVGFSFD